MKKLITTFAAVGLIGLAGCAAEDNDDVILDDPALETAPPIVSEPVTPPLTADTMMMDSVAAPIVDAPVDSM